jgi:aspartate racemase
MACNTAHARPILDVIERHVDQKRPKLRLVSMIESVKADLVDIGPAGRVAVLGTLGTHEADIYGEALRGSNWSARYLDTSAKRERLHRLIYAPSWGLKATGTAMSDKAASELRWSLTEAARLADVVLLACTELSMTVGSQSFDLVPVIDASRSLARHLVRIGRAADPHAT